jgi:hypothetical protein
MTPEITQENALERKRALNRLRVARYRERNQKNVTRTRTRGNGKGNGVMRDDNGKPNSTMERIALNLAKGLNGQQTLIQAGSSHHSRSLLDKAKSGLSEVLKDKGLTVARLAENVAKRLDATSPMFTQEGCIERPDWAAQSGAARDTLTLLDRAGELPQASQSSGNGNVTLVLQSLNVTVTPQDVVTDRQFTSNERVINAQLVDNTRDND